MKAGTEDFSINDVSRHVAINPDNDPYTVSVPEASKTFAAEGLPRSERAIQRFCKNGELICAAVETPNGSKYLITQSSIDRLIIQKQQVQKFNPKNVGDDTSRPVATDRDMPRQSTDTIVPPHSREFEKQNNSTDDARRDMSRHTATDEKNNDDLVEKLQSEIFDLKVDNAGKQNFIRQLASEREKMMNDVQKLSYNLGVAESRVAQLEAPKEWAPEAASRPVATSPDEKKTPPQPVGEGTDRITVAMQGPAHDAPQPKPSFLRRMFGN